MNKKAKLFKFLPYKINSQKNEIVFNYSLEFYNSPTVTFKETIILPQKTKKLEDKNIDRILKPLSIILGISYYKLYCPPKVELFFKISKEEAEFWNIVYRKGLGEFLYRNKLDPKIIAKFPYEKVTNSPIHVDTKSSILLGIGGGKDSIVAMKLLKDFDLSLFSVETMRRDPISENVIKKANRKDITIQRNFDSKILEMTDAYNGHIPVSAIYGFLGVLSCILYGHRYIVVGNEYSSNFGNIKYKGEVVNHQWSKSAEFESMFQDYIRRFITSDISYFSLLRQFYEIRIAEMFAKEEEYFNLFSSCNKNFKTFGERQKFLWCGECPKCIFVFLMFAPFIEKNKLIKIFGKNLLADEKLLPLYKDILGFGKLKPFDCVGTFEESQVALYLASRKGFNDDYIVKNLLPLLKNVDKNILKVFKTYNAPTLPDQFKLLGLKNICILGYGKEGKVTEKYLRKNHPKLEIAILDESLDKNYLEKQKNYDFAIKTPGIPKEKVTIPYATATNLFFAENEFSNNDLIIGVTGSKGKSTTVSLIYAILKSSGKKVKLLGNIGNPMLGALINSPKKGEIYVVELSSYMLDDIKYSPNIAVLLNLFPEHMDYHGGLKNYYQAKNNIFKFQKEGDLALKPPFKNIKLPFKESEVKLLGKHNLENIKVAVMVARILKIPDSKIRNTVINFKNLPHRLEYVGEFKGIKFYDDAISTTPESTIQALEAIEDVDTIMLGGEDRGYNFKNLEKVLRRKKVRNIVLFPDTGKRILKSKKGFNILETNDMNKAVAFAFKNTEKGKACLLSTASPSYSVWKNFEQKGDLYQSCIKNYGKN